MTLSYFAESGTRINERGLGKPNEDLLLVDRENHIFVLLDGITRVHKEYTDLPGKSAALDVGEIFLRTAYDYLLANLQEPDADLLLRQAALQGNAAIVPYRQQKPLEQWQFYPGTLGILAILRDNKLHYTYLGDSLGVHIRGNTIALFGRQEQLDTIAQMHATKKEMYGRYCNHPESPLGYGIFNGDASMAALLDQGVLQIAPGDTVILCTDGLAPYLCNTDVGALQTLTTEEMLDASVAYDVPPYASYADDKTIIKLSF